MSLGRKGDGATTMEGGENTSGDCWMSVGVQKPLLECVCEVVPTSCPFHIWAEEHVVCIFVRELANGAGGRGPFFPTCHGHAN